MQVALADASSHPRGMTQRGDHQEEHDRGNDGSSGDGEAAGGDEAGAEFILPAAQGRDNRVAACRELIEVVAQLDVKGLERLGELGRILGRVLCQARVFLHEAVDGKRGVEAADVICSGPEKDLGVAGLVAELGEGGVAGRDAGGDQFLMSESALGRSKRGYGGFGNVDLRIQRRQAHEGGAHQQADRGDQRDEQKTAEDQSLVETEHGRKRRKSLNLERSGVALAMQETSAPHGATSDYAPQLTPRDSRSAEEDRKFPREGLRG